MSWLKSDDVLGYIINSYAGIEETPGNPHIMRRMYLWQEEGEIKMGNTEAFVLHLGRRFGKKTRKGDASLIHAILRDLGELIVPHKKHASPQEDSPRAGRFKQPDPEEWVVRTSKKKE